MTLFKKIKVDANTVFLIFSKLSLFFTLSSINEKNQLAGASLPVSLYLFTLNNTKERNKNTNILCSLLFLILYSSFKSIQQNYKIPDPKVLISLFHQKYNYYISMKILNDWSMSNLNEYYLYNQYLFSFKILTNGKYMSSCLVYMFHQKLLLKQIVMK